MERFSKSRHCGHWPSEILPYPWSEYGLNYVIRKLAHNDVTDSFFAEWVSVKLGWMFLSLEVSQTNFSNPMLLLLRYANTYPCLPWLVFLPSVPELFVNGRLTGGKHVKEPFGTKKLRETPSKRFSPIRFNYSPSPTVEQRNASMKTHVTKLFNTV